MAANVAMRAAYQRLGFTVAAAVLLTEEQDQNDLDELRLLTDAEVTNLCKVVRRPGGTIAGPAPAGGGVAVQITNPGTSVSLRAENNLKLACFYLKHRYRVSRVVLPVEITLVNVRALIGLRLSEEKYKDPKDKPKISNKDWPKTMEAIEEYLRAYHGETGIPLAYVIRREVLAPAEEPVDGYSDVTDEMIARAPHLDAAGQPLSTYLADRHKVWELITEICREDDCWSYIKPAQRTRDGRKAYRCLYDHYLGPNNVDNMASWAERKLSDTHYQGEKKRWNFEKYVRTHVDQHSILSGLTEHGYAGIDERSKVRLFIEGIRTKELDSVKTQIMATAALRSDFPGCVSLYKDFISQLPSSQSPTELNVSATGVSNENKGNSRSNGGAVEDKYYSKEEYKKLSLAQKDTLREKRVSRGHKGNPRPAKRQRTDEKSDIDKLTRQVSKLATTVNHVAKERAADNDTSDDESEAGTSNSKSSKKGNRNNPSLTRQKKRS